MKSLENAMKLGKPCLLEITGEKLDPAFEILLSKDSFKDGDCKKMENASLPRKNDSKIYIVTNDCNKVDLEKISSKLTIINCAKNPR